MNDENNKNNNNEKKPPQEGERREGGHLRRRHPTRRRHQPPKETGSGAGEKRDVHSEGGNSQRRPRRRRRSPLQRGPRDSGDQRSSEQNTKQGQGRAPSVSQRGPRRSDTGGGAREDAPGPGQRPVRPTAAKETTENGRGQPPQERKPSVSRPSTPPRPNRRRTGRRPQPKKLSNDIPPGRMDRFSEIPDPPEVEATNIKDYEEMSDEQLTFLKHSPISDEFEEDFEDFEIPEKGHLMDLVGIKLHPADPVTYFDSRDLYLKKNDMVVVETKRGLSLGEVLIPTKRQYTTNTNLPRVIRVMSQGDMRQQERNREKEGAAKTLCKERIDKLRLPMKLIDVEYVHGGNKAVFYFAAEGRVDFRELVRDLAQRLHTRIEMRQIGVRDVSRMVGGIGVCGCQLCCNLYLREFKPISIRMAKDQNLVLNPQKVSGVCGRLLCCLTYENDVYRKAAKTMPRVGRRVITPDGEGRIRDRDVLKRIVRVQLNDEAGFKEYPVDQLDLDVPSPGADDNDTGAGIEREHEGDVRKNRRRQGRKRGESIHAEADIIPEEALSSDFPGDDPPLEDILDSDDTPQ